MERGRCNPWLREAIRKWSNGKTISADLALRLASDGLDVHSLEARYYA